jgi:hypothetical protein
VKFGEDPNWILIGGVLLIALTSAITFYLSHNSKIDDDVVIIEKTTKKKNEVVDFSTTDFISPNRKNVKIKIEKDAVATPVSTSRSGLRSHVLGTSLTPDGRRSLRISSKKNY